MPSPLRGVQEGLRDATQGGTALQEGLGGGQGDGHADPDGDQGERAELAQEPEAGS